MTKQKIEKKWIALAALGAVLGVPLLAAPVLFDSWVAEGPSMEPILVNEDRFATTPFATPELGDVVVIDMPSEGISVIKRILGVGGDTIEIRGNVFIRNGEPIVQSDPRASSDEGATCLEERVAGKRWTIVDDASAPPYDMEAVVVPANHVFIAGDRRDRANDSRFFGPVPTENILGVLVFRYMRGEGLTCP